MTHRLFLGTILLGAVASATHLCADEPFVPSTGVKVRQVGDDFEDPNWGYIMNGRKASHEQDEKQRPPGGASRNGRWYESALRGQPDVVKRVPTPPGGIEGSQGSMLMATRSSPSMTRSCKVPPSWSPIVGRMSRLRLETAR